MKNAGPKKAKSARLHPFSDLGPDFVVCRRKAPAPGPVPDPGATALLSGDLSRIEIAGLVNFLSMSRMTGVLLLLNGKRRKGLHFKSGELVFAESDDRDDRIGEVLVRLGKLNQRQLDAISHKYPKNMKIGRFMVQQELISPQTLWEGIRQQVREIFFGCLETEAGVFFFLGTGKEPTYELNLSLSTQNLLLEGVQRKDELSYFRKRILSDDIILIKRNPLPTKELTENERRLLQIVDGTLSISDLARHSQLERFVTLKTLFHLLQAGFFDICEKPAETAEARPGKSDDGGAGERRLQDIVGVFNEIFVEILQALRHKMPDAGAIKALNAFFQNVEPNLAALYRGIRLGEDGRLDGEALLRNLEGIDPPERGGTLTDGLKELFFFCVFEATSRLDRAGEEALLERIQKLQKNLRS
ncbi:MAG: DUF4388 domain-containing protein [Myxococcota bacterium]